MSPGMVAFSNRLEESKDNPRIRNITCKDNRLIEFILFSSVKSVNFAPLSPDTPAVLSFDFPIIGSVPVEPAVRQLPLRFT